MIVESYLSRYRAAINDEELSRLSASELLSVVVRASRDGWDFRDDPTRLYFRGNTKPLIIKEEYGPDAIIHKAAMREIEWSLYGQRPVYESPQLREAELALAGKMNSIDWEEVEGYRWTGAESL